MWNEGRFVFKEDVKLNGDVPITLMRINTPIDLEKGWGDTFIVTDAEKGTRVELLRDDKKPLRASGRIMPGGYAVVMPTIVGYTAFLAPPDSDFAYNAHLPHGLFIGLGRNGQEIKAGTVMNYRFATATLADYEGGNGMLEHLVKALNMGGGHDGYSVEMKVGTISDATFFFTAQAQNNEAAFTLGPESLPIDLPIRVRGLDDNGCAAAWSTVRPWFRFVAVDGDTAFFQEPIDKANDMWVGNIFVSDNKALKITVVVDGQADGAKPFVEVHNPTDAEVKATLRSPANAPLFGGMELPVKVPAGDSASFEIESKNHNRNN
jgi:hypothetical protein